MSLTHRFRLALAVVCLLAARTPVSAENAQVLLERTELGDAWTAAIVWLGVALLLALVLIAARHHELTLEQARWLGDVLRRCHARRAGRAAEGEAWAADAAHHGTVFGPPSLGVGKHFLLMLFAHGAVFAVAIANFASTAAPTRRGVGVLVLLALALGASVLASAVSAVSLAALPRSAAGVAVLCGALTLAFAAHALPPLAEAAAPALVGATVLSAILTGGVEQLGRGPRKAERRE